MRGLRTTLGACALAAAAPLSVQERVDVPPVFPGWPATFEGRHLQPLPLQEREAAFTRAFPGRVGRFDDGRRQVILRYVTRATRQLHPAADCFRGSGHAIRPLPVRRAADGTAWSCFEATGRGPELRVCERIMDRSGRSWSDVSSWYWSALTGTSAGPWWAATLVENAGAPSPGG